MKEVKKNPLLQLKGVKVDKYRIVEKRGEGGFGVTYKAIDTTMETPVAIKFLKTEDGSFWKQEAKKAALLRDAPQVATVFEFDERDVRVDGKTVHLKYIVWQYVEGTTLEEFIDNSTTLTSDIIVDLTEQICLGIAAMHNIGLEHGDLHSRNIMIVPPKPFDPLKRHSVKILDFGLASSMKGRGMSDMEALKAILYACWLQNQAYKGETFVSDKKFQSLLSILINRMEDPSLERRLGNPEAIITRIHQIKQEASIESPAQEVKLQNPFDFLSVEEMPENSDLIPYLYTDTVPWLKETTSFGTMVISGPRGSGKSMILKNMRLLTTLKKKDFSPKSFQKMPFLGFYIHCHQNLYMPFAGFGINYSSRDTLEKFVHYLNLLYTAEILESLISIDKMQVVSISPTSKQEIYEFLVENLLNKSDAFVISHESLLSSCKSIVEKEILYSQRRITEGKDIRRRTKIGYLVSLVKALDNIFEFFKNKQIYFLLDDYSDPKVSFDLQKSINRIIGFRNERFCFKISTEKFGFIPKDLDGKDLNQDREFIYLDLGGRYIKYHKPERKEFISNIISKRLVRAGLSITPYELFGTASINSIAESLLNEKAGGRKRSTRVKYAGFDVIYRLCMGDLSTMLQLCKEIHTTSLSERGTLKGGIDENLQDSLIRNFSKNRIDMIKEIASVGESLYHLIEIFGNISKKYLYDYERFHKKAKFLEVSRFELTESTNCLTKEAEALFRKLITEHIFLDAGGTYPWGKGISNLQLLLRPIYSPALKISYNNRYTIRISCELFNQFLTNPDKFERKWPRFAVSEDDKVPLTLDQFVKDKP